VRQLEPVYPDAKHPNSYQRGIEFQDFVCARLAGVGIVLQNLQSKRYQYAIGENLQGFEIKLDDPCTRTNRLSIEIAEKTQADHAQWTPSGIMRNDNAWLYLQGNYEVLYIFSKSLLRRYYAKIQPPVHELPTIQKFYIGFDVADRLAAKVMYFSDVTGVR